MLPRQSIECNNHNQLNATTTIGPDQWAAVYPMCAGSGQSPVDITEAHATVDASLSPIQFNWRETATQSRFEHQTCSTEIRSDNLWIRGGPLVRNETYFFSRFHLHEMSEHQINGMIFPVELHFVHISASGVLNNFHIPLFCQPTFSLTIQTPKNK